jgi:hypothetical protein
MTIGTSGEIKAGLVGMIKRLNKEDKPKTIDQMTFGTTLGNVKGRQKDAEGCR